MVVLLLGWEAATAGPRCGPAGVRGLGSGGASRGGGSPGLQDAQRPKVGDTAARARPLPRSAGVRSRVRTNRGHGGRPGRGTSAGGVIGDALPTAAAPKGGGAAYA